MAALEVEIETVRPYEGVDGRWATLKIGGVEVFSALVYDTDANGNRTEEQARKNLLSVFGQKMRRLLEDDE